LRQKKSAQHKKALANFNFNLITGEKLVGKDNEGRHEVDVRMFALLK
jgi:hypothetical protein